MRACVRALSKSVAQASLRSAGVAYSRRSLRKRIRECIRRYCSKMLVSVTQSCVPLRSALLGSEHEYVQAHTSTIIDVHIHDLLLLSGPVHFVYLFKR